MNFGLLTVQIQEDRGQKLENGKPLSLQSSVKYTKHRLKSHPPPLQMLYASFSRDFRMKQKARGPGLLKWPFFFILHKKGSLRGMSSPATQDVKVLFFVKYNILVLL